MYFWLQAQAQEQKKMFYCCRSANRFAKFVIDRGSQAEAVGVVFPFRHATSSTTSCPTYYAMTAAPILAFFFCCADAVWSPVTGLEVWKGKRRSEAHLNFGYRTPLPIIFYRGIHTLHTKIPSIVPPRAGCYGSTFYSAHTASWELCLSVKQVDYE